MPLNLQPQSEKANTTHTYAQERETGEVTLGLSAGGPLSKTEAANSGLKSKPKERGGWALCFGASLSTDHCKQNKMKRFKECRSFLHECLFFTPLLDTFKLS